MRSYEFLSPATITLNSERRQRAPYGLQGGDEGQLGMNQIVATDGTTQIVGGKYTTQVNAGDKVTIATPGGGGWGKP